MYFKEFMENLTECENIIHESELRLISIHPYELISDKESVLQEALDLKRTADTAIQKAIVVFQKVTKQFFETAFELRKRNSEWFEAASRFNVNNANLKDFSYSMFNFRVGVERIENIQIPKFESVNKEELIGDSSSFKQRWFKEVFVENKNKTEVIDDSYFRGSDEKIEIKESEVNLLFSFALKWLKNYNDLATKIKNENAQLDQVFNSTLSENKVVVNECSILCESIFRDEYYDILLEESLDPKDIEQENKEKDNTITTDSKEVVENKEKNSNLDAVKKYWKLCSSIQTKRMSAAREAYCAFSDFIDKVMKK